jgi:uncharacterized protein (TIGR02246 family)
MNLDQARAAAFVDRYGQTWESWDANSFVELFGDDVVYVAHPEEVVVGREALSRYLRKEQTDQGAVTIVCSRITMVSARLLGLLEFVSC